MKRSATVFGAAALLVIAACLTIAHAQQADKKKVIYTSSEKASYKEMAPGGASGATIWGDPDKGPHATFTKFKPGYDAGMHTHTNDVSIVVIKGAYLHIPGGHKHWSGGDKTEGALFYTEGSGKFDLIPAK